MGLLYGKSIPRGQRKVFVYRRTTLQIFAYISGVFYFDIPITWPVVALVALPVLIGLGMMGSNVAVHYKEARLSITPNENA